MAEPFLGQISIFGFNFAPQGWAFCNGQIMSIAQNTALFSLLGTTYGGNGQTTFALPDLRSRVPLHFGQGPGLSQYDLGQVGGAESITLLATQLAAHTHPFVPAANGTDATSGKPAGKFLANTPNAIYAATSDGTQMGSQTTAPAGGSQPHENRQPYLTLNFCIALQGIFPSRN